MNKTTVIVNKENDSYNSFITTDVDVMTSPFYYYYLNNELAKDFTDGAIINNGAILSCCPSIVSVIHAPFLDISSIQLSKIPYDTETFGQANGVILPWDKIVSSNKKPSVYRINSSDGINQLSFKNKLMLRRLEKYPKKESSNGERHYKNESKLLQFPYRYFDINDFYNPPLRIKPHLIFNDYIKPYIITTISNKATYCVGVENYKNDTINLESQISNANFELPITSNQYNQYFAQNKNQLQMQTNMNFLNTIGGVTSSLAYGNVNGGVSSFTNGLFQSEMLQAKKTDMINAPKSVISLGGDAYFSWALGESRIYSTEYTIQEEYKRQIGDFFAKFGYKQLKVFKPNLRSRYFYNYIKTIDVNLSSNGIPKIHLDEIKELFNNGLTIWHKDRENVQIGDYSKDNYEV